MMGMEKMLASMIGMTPEEMQGAAKQMHTGLLELAGAVKSIDEKCDVILAKLEALQNDDGNGNGGDNGNRPRRGRRANGGAGDAAGS